MPKGKTNTWPGENERQVVEEMLRDFHSSHWGECYEFMDKIVGHFAANLPSDLQEDIVQEAMLAVTRDLSSFRFNSRLRTWLTIIARHRIIDMMRKTRVRERLFTPWHDLESEDMGLEHSTCIHPSGAAEDQALQWVMLREGIEGLEQFIKTHANPVRNKNIVRKVLLEGSSIEETAKALNISAPVVGYIIRSTQRFIREKQEE